MKAHQHIASLLKYFMMAALLLMAVGFVFLFTENHSQPPYASVQTIINGFNSPDSIFFFTLGTVMLLAAPPAIAFFSAVIYMKQRHFKLVILSALVFCVLLATVALKI